MANKNTEETVVNNTPVEVEKEKPIPRAIRKYKKSAVSYNMGNVNTTLAGKAYLEGKITQKEWSLMSPALRKAAQRWAKQHKNNKVSLPVAEDSVVKPEIIETNIEAASKE